MCKALYALRLFPLRVFAFWWTEPLGSINPRRDPGPFSYTYYTRSFPIWGGKLFTYRQGPWKVWHGRYGLGMRIFLMILWTPLPLPANIQANRKQWHQFLTETAATISGPWEKEIPRLATSCDYLMHIILSTAALHLAYLNPEQRDKYEYIASQHRDLGIGPFRRALSKITLENCNEVFAFSSLMVLAQFAPSHSPNEVFLQSSTPALYTGPANWIVCLRGCVSIANQAMPYIRAGPLGSLMAQGTQVSNLARTVSAFPENDDDRSLEYISENLLKLPSIKASTTVDEMESYIEAISWLRRLLAASSADSDSLTCRIFSSMWPTRISDTFIRTLNEERPAALVITAHYCLLLQRCHSCWHMEHRANALLISIQQSLATGWAPYIERPVKVIQNAQLDLR